MTTETQPDTWKLTVCRECRWRQPDAIDYEAREVHAPGCSEPDEFDYEFVVPAARAERAERRVLELEGRVSHMRQYAKRAVASLARGVVRGRLPDSYWTRDIYKQLDRALNGPNGSDRPFPSRNS